MKRTIFAIALAAGLAAWIGAAQAQNFPVRPVTLIVAAMANLDQELFYLSSEDYQKFAMQQIEEARRFVAELGLKQD